MKQLLLSLFLFLSFSLFGQEQSFNKKHKLFLATGINQQVSVFNRIMFDNYNPDKKQSLGYQVSLNVLTHYELAFFKIGGGLVYSSNNYEIYSQRTFSQDILNNTSSYNKVTSTNQELLFQIFFQEDLSEKISYAFGFKYIIKNFGNYINEDYQGYSDDLEITFLENKQSKIIASLNMKLKLLKNNNLYFSPTIDIILPKEEIEFRDFYRALFRFDLEYKF